MQLPGFPVTISIEVRFRDLDAMGHVNNAVFLTYFEMARMAYFKQLALQGDTRPPDMILAEATCTYRSPGLRDEILLTGIRINEIGRSSFQFGYEIRGQAAQRLVASGHTIQVMYDYDKSEPRPIPAGWAEAIDQFQGMFTPRKGSKTENAE